MACSDKTVVCTWLMFAEVVVVLGDVGDHTQLVGHTHGHHVLRVQQRWDPQLILRYVKRLVQQPQGANNSKGTC